ncbi:MAG: hypothetical protein H6Q04_1893 [Acidobacteria bacterium]|nr:hypothetical protein [Acidobacteriota bacterium]
MYFQSREKTKGFFYAFLQFLALFLKFGQTAMSGIVQVLRSLQLALQFLVFISKGIVFLSNGFECFDNTIELVLEMIESFEACEFPFGFRFVHNPSPAFRAVGFAKKHQNIIAEPLHAINR